MSEVELTPGTVDPRIGDTKKSGTWLCIWAVCLDCGKERWVALKMGHPQNLRCQRCAAIHRGPIFGERSPNYKRGWWVDKGGYKMVRIYPDNFFYPMANSSGQVREHRLVVAKALGRNLHPWEIVHHKGAKYPKGSGEDKQDNRYPENLQLVSDDRHRQITILETKIKNLEKQNCKLKAENEELRGKMCEHKTTQIIPRD